MAIYIYIYIYFEIVLNGLAFNLQSLYGTFNFIASCSFLLFSTYKSLSKTTSWVLISDLYYIILYIYIWKEIKIDKHIIFELQSYKLFKKQFFIVLNTYRLLLLTTHKNILSFTKFYGKRKYYKKLISYEQCRLTRIISKSGWAVVSWGQRAETICLTISDIL